MKRSSSSALGIIGGLALASACTPAPNILPSNDFNRPTDIAFMCLGAHGTPGPDGDGGTTDDAGAETSPFVVSGRPMYVCHPPPKDGVRQAQPGAAISSRTYAFVPNSASGDLSVIDGDSWKLVDLDKATGGYGRAPLGTLPEQISASSDGCRLVTANRGSCDLSVVNPSTLLASRFAAEYNSDTVSVTVPPGNGIQRVTPMRGDGMPLGAAPYEVVFLPIDTSAMNASHNLCPADGAGGSWRALATFPACDLVAILDLPSGNIVASAKMVKATGPDPFNPSQPRTVITLVDQGTSPQCLAECGSGRAQGPAPFDAGAGDDGGTSDGGTTPGPTPAEQGLYRPTGIAITPRADHAYVSLANYPAVVSFGLTPTAFTAPQNSIELHENAQGSNRIRLGVDPNKFATTTMDFAGVFVGQDAVDTVTEPPPDDPTKKGAPIDPRGYLYVVARDGSLRIVDVAVFGDPTVEVECETNFDPLANPPQSPNNRCIRWGTVKRRQYSGTATAGLRFPTPVIDVAAADMTSTQQEETVNGGYAWVLTASSSIYLVNITPDQRRIKAVVRQNQRTLFPLTPENTAEGFVYKNADPTPGLVYESPPFPNQPRDRNVVSYTISLDPTLGPTRLDTPPIALLSGPYIEPFYTQGTQDNATSLDPQAQPTYVFFPDRQGATAQGWDVSWQGTLVSPRYSGILHGTKLDDRGGGFCSAGVLAGDIVTIRGCGSDSECPLGMVCHRDSSLDQVPGGLTVTGLCVSSNQPSLTSQCAPYVSSVRRYEIVAAKQSSLILKPHLDELVRSALTPCQIQAGTTGADGGTAGADGGSDDGGAGDGGAMTDHSNDCFDPTDSTTPFNQFVCVDVGLQPRCLNPCKTDQDCRRGRTCQTLSCTSLWDCPSGTKECKNGLCFTDVVCNTTSTPRIECESGKTCSNYTSDTDQRCTFDQRNFCADAPPLGPDGCFPQLTSYQVNINAGFHVTGTASGAFDSGTTNNASGTPAPDPKADNDLCRPFTAKERDPRLVSRIPLRPPPNDALGSGALANIDCGATVTDVFPTMQTTMPSNTVSMNMSVDQKGDGYFIDHFDPLLAPVVDSSGREQDVVFGSNRARPEAPQLVEWMKQWTSNIDATPNPCLYLGGPVSADSNTNNSPLGRMDRPQHARARFRNTEVAFVLTNLDRAPAAGSTVHFEVHGGFRPQAVLPLPTVEISAPARLVLGPVDSIPKDTVNVTAANFFFVVDQRRLGRSQGGGPTRGQIVRVRPFGYASTNGNQPIFEDYSASGGLFPIQ